MVIGPRVTLVSWNVVLLRYNPPTCVSDLETVLYQVKYRTTGQRKWMLMPETKSLSQTIANLQTGHYQFTVVAKYKGGVFGPETERVNITIKRSAGEFLSDKT